MIAKLVIGALVCVLGASGLSGPELEAVSPDPSPPVLASARPTLEPGATPAPRPTVQPPHWNPTLTLAGVATWHATGRNGLFAAAGPRLRAALGPNWRGRIVRVCRGSWCIRVRLNDACWCPRGNRIIDLSDEAFRFLTFGRLGLGIVAVKVRW